MLKLYDTLTVIVIYDFVLHSDYNAKKSEMQYLHKKALDKNPDEFYYKMISSEITVGGLGSQFRQLLNEIVMNTNLIVI
jgi:hypothetical protein